MSKKSFAIIFIAFFSCQVITDLLHSVTVFPFLHYGMYSASVEKPDSIVVYEIIANGKPLLAADFRIIEWSMIHSPLMAIEKQQATADYLFDKQHLEKAMKFVGLATVYTHMEPNLQNDSVLNNRFIPWYKSYLEGILHQSIHSLQVNNLYYGYEHGKYFILKKENWINS